MTLQFLESPFSTELKLSNLKSCNERNSSNPHDPVTLLLYQMNSYLSENFIILIIFFWKLWASIGRSNWKRCKRRYCQGRAQWKTLWEYSISTTHVMRLVTNITAWGNLCHHFGHQILLRLSWIDPWYLDFDNNACIRYALKEKKRYYLGIFPKRRTPPRPPLLGTPYPKATTLSILEWWLNEEIDKISLPPHL